MKKNFPCILSHVVCFSDISAESSGTKINYFYSVKSNYLWGVVQGSTTGLHSAWQCVVPTRAKTFGKIVWKNKLQLFTQSYQASLLQSHSLYFGNKSEQWRSFVVEPRCVCWAETWCSSTSLSHTTTNWAQTAAVSCCYPSCPKQVDKKSLMTEIP